MHPPESAAPRRRRGFRGRVVRVLHRVGVLDAVHRAWRDRLTVLAYHRIGDPETDGRRTLKSNISATPVDFAAQMEFLSRRFDVISLGDLQAWLLGARRLPPYPALVTFDDGYRDNLTEALPVLRRLGLPAVLFVATDCVRTGAPYYWDRAAYCFQQTTLPAATLPILGPASWQGEVDRTALLERWLAAAKRLPDEERLAASLALPASLAVAIPADAFASLHLGWDEVRALRDGGVAIGAHTRSHPILTRLSPAAAEAEIAGSVAEIAAALGTPVTTFAYPNGGPADFDGGHRAMLRRLGIQTGFTLVPGPQGLSDIRRDPLAIRRIFIGNRDDLPRFAAKLSGVLRLAEPARQPAGAVP